MKPNQSFPSKVSLEWMLAMFLAAAFTARGDIVVPGADGSDGAFNPTNANTVIDLSLAPTGVWNGTNSSPGRGVYDPEKWAVVFRYSSVNIPANVTVRFRNHPANPPVVWLVSGEATIDGTVDVSGEGQGTYEFYVSKKPGPGGFRGGVGSLVSVQGRSAGFGVGGGASAPNVISGGSFATRPHPASGPTYGSSTLIPLMGGSGGGGGDDFGGTGGGAILIASTKTLWLRGSILAKGGVGYYGGGHGSGGAVKLVADRVIGNGRVRAVSGGFGGGNGRIRIETLAPFGGMDSFPVASYAPLTNAVQLWPAPTAPRVAIQSVGPASAPADPHGGQTADIEFPVGTGTNTVTVEAFNLPATAQVMLRATPFSGPHQEYLCTKVSGDDARSLWQANVRMPPGAVSFQVRATTQ